MIYNLLQITPYLVKQAYLQKKKIAHYIVLPDLVNYLIFKLGFFFFSNQISCSVIIYTTKINRPQRLYIF